MALRSGALVGEGLVSFGSSAFKLCLGESCMMKIERPY